MIVIILNHDTQTCNNNITQLKLHLDYDIIVLKEDYRFALKYAKKHYPNEHCLIIKDSSIIQYNIKNNIDKLLSLNADISFLCTWLDDCHKYTNTKYDHIKYTSSSFADQAILYKPETRNHILKHLKSRKLKYILLNDCNNLCMVACIPNIIHVDLDLIKSNNDLYKLNKVLIQKIKKQPSNTNNAAWIILIVIFIILLVLLVPYLKSRKSM